MKRRGGSEVLADITISSGVRRLRPDPLDDVDALVRPEPEIDEHHVEGVVRHPAAVDLRRRRDGEDLVSTRDGRLPDHLDHSGVLIEDEQRNRVRGCVHLLPSPPAGGTGGETARHAPEPRTGARMTSEALL